MADTKTTALTERSVPVLTDLTYLVEDPAGTPASRKLSLNRLLGMLNHVCQGRLTLTSGTPVPTTDVTGATSIYWTPYGGNLVSLYDGTRWRLYTFTEKTFNLGTLVNAQAYDLFLYDNSGTLTLEAAEWSNATATMTIASPCVVTWTGHGLSTGDSVTFTTSGALPTGVSANTQYWITKVDANTFNLSTSLINVAAGTKINTSGSQSGTHTAHAPRNRQTALTTQDGVEVKSGDATRRYLGTFFTTSTTTTEDSEGGTTSQVGGKRFLWNRYNQVVRHLQVKDDADNWTYSNASYRQAGGAAGNRVECVVGMAISNLSLSVLSTAATGVAGWLRVAIGQDSASAADAACTIQPGSNTTNQFVNCSAVLNKTVPIGYHSYTWLEYGIGSGTQTWYGNQGGPDRLGLNGTIQC